MTKRKRAVKRTTKHKVKQVVKRKRTSYSIEQKLEVVTYAKEHGRNKAGQHFNLNPSMVGRWIVASSKWSIENNGKSKRVGSGRKALFPEAEKRLYDWTIEQRK